MLRQILGLLAGLATAVATVAVVEGAGHMVFPPPPGTDLAKPDDLETIIDKLPVGAIVAVLVAWAAGAFLGGAVAARVTGRASSAWMIGVAMLLAGIATMLAIPHPFWFQMASVPASLVPAWLAGLLFTPARPAPAP
jgi:hypothetical protein